MWFKNLRLYVLTEPFKLTPEELEDKLVENVFRPCSSFDKSSLGWVSPLGREGEMLTHTIGDYTMVCAQEQERLLPVSVVRDATEEKVAELEERQARKVYRKERRQIQEDIYASLLPQAFLRNQQLFAYIAPKQNLLVVNTPSVPKAEALLNLLRDSLGSLQVAKPDVKRSPGDVMTRWLKEQKATHKFVIEHDCELYNPLDGSNVVRCKGQDLLTDELRAMLSADKRVKSLGVSWNSRVNCIVHDDLSVKRLRFEGVSEESLGDQVESAAQQFDQEFALMSMELSGFFRDMFTAFGGLKGE
ncbi:MAG: recombination-associated protein RdgC [Gammaproteobacteria bacterium]|nr:recombination-associated protein RdgC [Gammaproteobacteria bacterium]